jgi:NADPH:quinone reductase-like Zn-dependent oxidoreductase
LSQTAEFLLRFVGGPHKPDRQDFLALIDLLQQQAIQPFIEQRFCLVEARRAQELLEKGGVTGKIVLVANEPSQTPAAA